MGANAVLNIGGSAWQQRAGQRRNRFSTAWSQSETRAAIQLAVARGHVGREQEGSMPGSAVASTGRPGVPPTAARGHHAPDCSASTLA